jgi:hypothetical protein
LRFSNIPDSRPEGSATSNGWESAGFLQVKLRFIRQVSIEQLYKTFESYLLGQIAVFWPCQELVEVAVRYGRKISVMEIIG